MSRKSRKQRRYNSGNCWQSDYLNQTAYMFYRHWLLSLAVNRFKWQGLPETCDERYLEITLLFEGQASIAAPKKTPGVFYSTQVAFNAPINLYDNPTSWRSVGNNGWNFAANNSTGVIVFDNRLRSPIIPYLEYMARRLSKVDRVADVNMMHQFTPWVLEVQQNQVYDAQNLIKQVLGGEPAVLGYQGLTDAVKPEVLGTDVPFIGNELNNMALGIWNTIFRFLGIPAMNEKAERLITAEVQTQENNSDLMALDGLGARREACDKFNKRFGHHYGIELSVNWNTDYLSNFFNFMHDPIARLGAGGSE